MTRFSIKILLYFTAVMAAYGLAIRGTLFVGSSNATIVTSVAFVAAAVWLCRRQIEAEKAMIAKRGDQEKRA